MAVILYGTGDPTANTTAPTGAFANSGWQFEGKFDGFLGTVIAPNYFIMAKHIGGSVSDTFSFNGTNYTPTAVFPDPSSDLQIWRVSGTFPIGNDVSAVQGYTRLSVSSANFRYDVNADGIIDGNDVSITQGQTRTALPSNFSRARRHVSPLPGKPDTFKSVQPSTRRQ